MDLGDEELVAKARAGNREAFAVLTQRHQVSAFNLALRMVGNREDAEEATQDAFVRVYRNLDKFRGDARFVTWLYRIVVNVCLSMARRSRRKPDTITLSPDEVEGFARQMPVSYLNPEAIFEQNEFKEQVRTLISKLPPLYSAVITMHHLQSLSYDEIAESLEVPIGTVKARLFRARVALRNLVLSAMARHSMD